MQWRPDLDWWPTWPLAKEKKRAMLFHFQTTFNPSASHLLWFFCALFLMLFPWLLCWFSCHFIYVSLVLYPYFTPFALTLPTLFFSVLFLISHPFFYQYCVHFLLPLFLSFALCFPLFTFFPVSWLLKKYIMGNSYIQDISLKTQLHLQ